MTGNQAKNSAGDRVENLINGYRLLQREPHCRLGMDAVLLAAFLSPAKALSICDLGSGGGAVTILLAARYPDAIIDGVEIQPTAAALLQDNILLNGLACRVRAINGDLRTLEETLPAGTYSAVVCNPPYFAENRGKAGANEENRIERSEVKTDLRDICRSSARLLKNGGELAMVCRTDRLCDLMIGMRTFGIEPKKLKFIQHTAHTAPKLMLISGRRNAAPGLKTEPPLLIHREDGEFSEEYLKIYQCSKI